MRRKALAPIRAGTALSCAARAAQDEHVDACLSASRKGAGYARRMPPRFDHVWRDMVRLLLGLSRHQNSLDCLAGSDRLRSASPMALPGDTPEQLAGIISKLLTDLVARNDQVRSLTQHAA